MCTTSLIYYTGNSLALCLHTIPAASGGACKTVHETAPLAFVFNLGLGLFIIYVGLHWVKNVKIIRA